MDTEARAVLRYWFGDAAADPTLCLERNAFWFQASARQDREIARRFGRLHVSVAAGERDDWQDTARGTLALIVVLDQFSRNLHRGTPAAFAQDQAALGLAGAGLERGQDRQLSEIERAFFYMPFQHAEDLALQQRSLALYNALRRGSRPEFRLVTEYNHRFAVEHAAIVSRFGRFPHRNRILGRESTAAEHDFLESGGKTFGQS